MENKFRSDRNQTKAEFLSQFVSDSEEITVKIRWSWSRGSSGFDSIDKEVLIYVNYLQPWTADNEHPFGIGGQIYWLGKKKLIGYPYPPHLVQDKCYRLRVRRCTSGENFFLLEDVIDSNVDVSDDEGIYKRCYERLMNRFDTSTKDVLIYCVNDVDVSKAKRAAGLPIGYAYADYSAIIDEDGGSPKMVGRSMTIPFDGRNLAENKKLRFKAGKIYKVRVYTYKNSSGAIALDRILDDNVQNDALSHAGEESLKPVKWPVEGFADFIINWDSSNMQASNECISWDPSDADSEVSIYLQCDPDNCHTAYKTTKDFLDLYKNKAAFEKKIFEAVADDLSEDGGMIETWDEGTGTISREDFIKRLSFCVLSFELEGVDILVSLDELFTDHAYSLYMNHDGSISVNGLWG